MIRLYRRVSDHVTALRGVALLVLRVVAGWLFILHGLFQFQLGQAKFTATVLVPAGAPLTGLLSWFVPTLELLGGALLVVGLLTRVVAAVLAIEMICTGFLVKLAAFHTGVLGPNGIGGAELDFLYVGTFLLILVSGPGRLALDVVLGMEQGATDPGQHVGAVRADGPASASRSPSGSAGGSPA